MQFLNQFGLLFRLSHSGNIARRYLVVNGFDGALTMLGIIVGFYQAGETPIPVIISACLGAAIALGVSGLSSAYISEAAERKVELGMLEDAMITDLGESAQGLAARLIPFSIALVNGLAPFVISMLIILPLWLPGLFAAVPVNPLEAAMGIALVIIFMLGIFLGRISGRFWFISGLRTLLIALATGAIIVLLSPVS